MFSFILHHIFILCAYIIVMVVLMSTLDLLGFDLACLMADEFWSWLVLICLAFRWGSSDIIENCCPLLFFMTIIILCCLVTSFLFGILGNKCVVWWMSNLYFWWCSWCSYWETGQHLDGFGLGMVSRLTLLICNGLVIFMGCNKLYESVCDH